MDPRVGVLFFVSRPGFIPFQMRYIKVINGLSLSLLNPEP
jgi:hypothetical protein